MRHNVQRRSAASCAVALGQVVVVDSDAVRLASLSVTSSRCSPSAARGVKAIEHGYRVLFATAAAMIAKLPAPLAEGNLEEKLKQPRRGHHMNPGVGTFQLPGVGNLEFVDTWPEPPITTCMCAGTIPWSADSWST